MANSPKLVEFYKLITITHRLEVAQKLLARYNHRTSAVVGVEAEALGILKVLIEKEMHVVLLIVDKSEGRHRAWLQTQIALHTLWRGEAQLSLSQTLLKVVDSQILVAVEAYQVVAIALVVTEKEVFAVYRPIIVPILLGNLDCRRCGVRISLIFYVVCIQKFKDSLTA